MGPIVDENRGREPTVWEVCRPKSELGEPGTVALISMGGTILIESNGKMLEEMAEIHDLLQIQPVESPSIWVLRRHLRAICSSALATMPLYTLVIPLRRDWYQERGQSTTGTQKKRGRGRFGPDCGRKSWVLAHGLGSSSSEIGIWRARYRCTHLDVGNERHRK